MQIINEISYKNIQTELQEKNVYFKRILFINYAYDNETSRATNFVTFLSILHITPKIKKYLMKIYEFFPV